MAAGRLIVVCGLPGSGKTTLARRIVAGRGDALRFCPDEWMAALGVDLWDQAMRSRVEQLQWRVAQDFVRTGGCAVIEWGVWARSERDELRKWARGRGVAVELRYLELPMDELWARVQQRNASGVDHTVEMSRAQLEEWTSTIEVPSAAELALYDPPEA
jgi:predicted kinase